MDQDALKERFVKGDRVKVVFNVQGQEQYLRCEFISGPQGPGDTFKLVNEGGPMEINGNGPSFDGIYPDPEWPD